VVEGMLSNSAKHVRATESELYKIRKRLEELETTLTMERGESQRTARDLEEKLVRAREERDSYVNTITNQALDITTGICNVSGKLIPEDDTIYIMELCGAVST
jgi:predicted  nucleic acid-binding Zn-ribbon protein